MSTAAHWYRRRNLITGLIKNQAVQEEKTIEAVMSWALDLFVFPEGKMLFIQKD